VRLSQNLQDERDYVESALNGFVICGKCGATLQTYADKCTADLQEACGGFKEIERAKARFRATSLNFPAPEVQA
jgi:ribosomal protein L40E